MTKEQLIANGLTDAQAESVLKLHKETLDGNFIPKHRFDEVNNELKAAKEQVSERDKQIGELKKFEGTNAELSEKLKKLEEENAAKEAAHKEAIAKEKKVNAVRFALLEDDDSKPHDIDMVLGLFDLDKITIDESTNKITKGFSEQSEALKKEKAFLFSKKEEQKPQYSFWKPAGTPPTEGKKDPQKVDPAESYGKSLAQSKLAQMGISPVEKKTN